MLKRIFAKPYRSLPVIRESYHIKALLQNVTASLQNIMACLRNIENYLKELKATQTMRLVDFDLRDHPRYGDPQRLLRYQAQVCSQNGEDGIIHEIFCRIGTGTRIFAEVGVGDGSENNTAFLLSQGWTGFWFDGSSAFIRALENREDLQKDCLKYLVAFATRENISALFEQLGVPKEFDLLSLDIDQNNLLRVGRPS